MSAKPNPRSLVPSSLLFRICIGGIAIAFLAVVVLGNMIFEGPRILDSISSYYYSSMKNVFVGGLCVLATLLMCYRYQPKDHVVSFVAGACAILLAIFPTTDPHNNHPTQQQINIGIAHWVFSIGFLLAIVVIVLYLFTLSDQNPKLKQLIQPGDNWFQTIVYTVRRPFMRSDQKTPLGRKLWRNRVYLVCGSIMIVSLVLCLIDQTFFSTNSRLESISPVFCCEASTLFFFFVAWVVKGGVILLDENTGGVITFFRTIISGKVPQAKTIPV
jgi:hypothetical protein